MKPIVYKDAAGLKMRITRLTHNDKNKPEILLLPMMHVADASFYDEMFAEKRKCHVVLFEGASPKVAKWAGLLYRLIGRSKKLGLTLQSEVSFGKPLKKKRSIVRWFKDARKDPYKGWSRPVEGGALEKTIDVMIPTACECGRCATKRAVRYLRADLGDVQTESSLKKMPWWVWPLLPVIAIAAGLYFLICATRKDFTDHDFENNELEKALENPDNAFGILAKYVLTDREEFLFKTLAVEIDRPENANKLIGVEYGAAHMDRTIEYLRKYQGYECTEQTSVLCVNAVPELEEEIERYAYEKLKFKRRKSTCAAEAVDLPHFSFDITKTPDIVLTPKGRQEYMFGYAIAPVTSGDFNKKMYQEIDLTGPLNQLTEFG